MNLERKKQIIQFFFHSKTTTVTIITNAIITSKVYRQYKSKIFSIIHLLTYINPKKNAPWNQTRPM